MPDLAVLEGQTALVTGAGRGIGQAIAIAMAEAGANLILTSRSVERLGDVTDRASAAGAEVIQVEADFTAREDVLALADRASHVDILVNNAVTEVLLYPLTERHDEHWDRSFAVDFFAPMLLTREIGREMVARNSGSIINISSIVGELATTLTGPYGTSQAALNALTRIAALEMAPSNVRVNAIAPGLHETDLARESLDDATWAHMVSQIPLGRAGQTSEIAALCVFLASPGGAFIVGQVINADGGATAGDFHFAAAAAEGAA
jgi:NAD(P)-dependent dehydrogenase (short-subunit alcohol dehydrogenase family)